MTTSGRGRPIRAALALAALALALGGCARLHARTEPAIPPLALPPAPPHDVTPAPLPSSPGPVGPGAGASEPAKKPVPDEPVERRRTRPAPAAEPPAHPAAQPPMLQTAPAASMPQAAQRIRETLAKAGSDLGQVDYQSLSTDAKAQYDTARRFIRQAEEALSAGNYVFARSLADKAAVLAALLHGGL
ncbi:MAG: hypothetical protein KGN76_02735 [Acidobacteriota bacterium]|nr:hypothetical protein [Acidobacteriota bacterium]